MSILKRLGVPIFNAERTRRQDVEGRGLEVAGMVEGPCTFTLGEVRAMPMTVVNARLTSVSGWSVRADWGGVLWTDFETHIRPLSEASHVTFSSPSGYDTTVALAELRTPRVLLAWQVDGEEIEFEYGGPLRMVIPQLWGYKSCKWLVRIELCGRMRGGYWEDRGYSRDAFVQPGTTRDLNDGAKAKRIAGGGEVTEF